jgi:hypothetical protein
MKRFVLWFPIALCLFLSVALLAFLSAILNQQQWGIAALAAPAANLLLWMVLGPVMARFIQARTCRGLDALLWSMAQMGSAAELSPAAHRPMDL